MASIARRPDRRWRARYRDDTGREHARHFDRKLDAQRWLDGVTASVVTGQYVGPKAGRVTFREYAEGWRATAVHRQATRDRVERALRLHVYPVLGDQPIGSIRASTVQAMVTAAAGTLAPNSLRAVYSVLSGVFSAAVRDRVVPSSPCVGVRLPEQRRQRVEVPPIAVLDRLSAALPPRLAAVVPLVAGSGLRLGEVAGLEVGRVDFLRRREVAVVQQLATPDTGRPFLAPVKTPESERTVPLAQVTLDALAAHLAAFPAVEVEVEDRVDPRPDRESDARRPAGVHPRRRPAAATQPLVGAVDTGRACCWPAGAHRPAHDPAPVRVAADPPRRERQDGPVSARTCVGCDHARHLLAPLAGRRRHDPGGGRAGARRRACCGLYADRGSGMNAFAQVNAGLAASWTTSPRCGRTARRPGR
jgi:integrase